MPTKNSSVLAARVMNETIAEIKKRLPASRNKTINSWINWCIGLGLRKHDKKENDG